MKQLVALSFIAGLASAAMLQGAAAEARSYDHGRSQRIAGSERASVQTQRATRQTPVARKVDPRFLRQPVRLATKEKPGTIIIDTDRKFLYFVEAGGAATRYGVGVGREGFTWGGTMKVGRKAEWPGWTPPAEMVRRERAQGRTLPAYMAGGPENPLGARAMYLYRGGRDSMFRIHGTNQPWTIGLNMSSGCIRMMNQDVIELYERVTPGTKVIVIGPGAKSRDATYVETGTMRRAGNRPNLLQSIFGG